MWGWDTSSDAPKSPESKKWSRYLGRTARERRAGPRCGRGLGEERSGTAGEGWGAACAQTGMSWGGKARSAAGSPGTSEEVWALLALLEPGCLPPVSKGGQKHGSSSKGWRRETKPSPEVEDGYCPHLQSG